MSASATQAPLFGEIIKKTRSTLQNAIGSRRNNIDHDFYPTPPIATIELMERMKFKGSIWECACGDGSMSTVLEDYGYPVRSTDLIYRGYGESRSLNFLRSTERAENIVTNPPFKKANQFIAQALKKADRQVALLMRLNYVSSGIRKKFFQGNWDRSYKGKPGIEWI